MRFWATKTNTDQRELIRIYSPEQCIVLVPITRNHLAKCFDVFALGH